MPAFGELAMAKLYYIQDKRSNRGRRHEVKVQEDSTWVKRSGSIVSQDQGNRVAREYSFTRTTPAG